MKKIKTLADLAINGAPPAFGNELHVGRPNLGNQERFVQYAREIFQRRWLTNRGPLVQKLEQRLAEVLGVKHCVAMCNGTIALEIASRAIGLKGEVIVPSYTFIATAHALQWQGITPVFADIDPATHNLDPVKVRRMITPRTTGIVGVHLWGRSSPVEALQDVATEFGLELMFDAAHAFGCTHRGVKIANFGRCSVFSFHATKVFNTFEGGAVATNDDDLAAKLRLMQNFGFAGLDRVIYPGTNGKMTEIQAAMGLVNLESVDTFIDANTRNHKRYRLALDQINGLSLLSFPADELQNYQYAVVEIGDDFPWKRDKIVRVLQAENVLARKYFWPGAHAMEPYRSYYPHAELLLPETKKVADRVIVLPTGPAIGDTDIDAICAILAVLACS